MRICLITSSLASGGAENVLVEMANYWVGKEHSVKLIVFNAGSPFFELDRKIEICQLDIPTTRRSLLHAVDRMLRRAAALRREVRKFSPDVAISFLGKINVLTMAATRGLGVPVILSERNNPVHQRFRPSWRFARDLSYLGADCVVVPTQGAMNWLPEAVRRRAALIPNPVTTASGPPVLRPAIQTIVAVGRLTRQKGFDMLLRAFAPARRDWPELRLVIRGEGEERQELESLRGKLGLDDRVSMPGVTPRPRQWLEEGEIFVLSSRYEGFGNVLLEAMSHGMAVISFDCPWGPGEMISDGEDGILVPPEDVDGLAQAIRRLVADPALCHRLGVAAQRNARRFDRQHIMGMWDDLLLRLTDRKRRTR